MKKLMFLLTMVVVCKVTFGQDSLSSKQEGKDDVPSIRVQKQQKDGKTKTHKIDVGFVSHDRAAYFGFYPSISFGWNRFMDKGSLSVSSTNADLTLDKGPEFSIFPIGGGVYLNKAHTLKISTALGFTYNTYHFERDITLEKGKDKLTYTINEDAHFSKNLLRSTYLTMPLNLTIRPVRGSKFIINAGVEGGLFVGGKTKQINKESGKVKKRGSFNLNPVRYGLNFGIGYENFNIYAKYYLSDVFAKNEGPEDFKTVAIGINFSLF